MQKYIKLHTAPGQSMIVSTIVLGFLTLTFVLTGIASLGQEQLNNSVLENKTLSEEAASGCMDQALNRIGLNNNYVGNETLTIASSTCTIATIASGTSTWIVQTSSNVATQYTRYIVYLSSLTPVTISSWTEI